MLYDEYDLESLFNCLKCGQRYDLPIILPCGYLICQRCIIEIQKLVECLNEPEFHCQLCNNFHEFQSSAPFPTCHQIASFLTHKPGSPKNEKSTHPQDELPSLDFENDLNEFNIIDGDLTVFFDKLKSSLNYKCESSIEKIVNLKYLMLSEIDECQKECESSNELIEDEKLSPRNLYYEWQKKLLSFETFNDAVSSFMEKFKEKLEAENSRFKEFILEKKLLEVTKILEDIQNDFFESFEAKKLKDHKIRIIKELRGHSDSVYSVATLSNNKIASGSCDGTIKIWDTENGILEKTLAFHKSSVNSLVFLSRNRIASGSWDKTIKISDIDTGNLLDTLNGHMGVVYSLVALENDQIASGSIDGTVKIWQLNSPFKLRLSLDVHADGVYSLAVLKKNHIASGFTDGIKIWNFQTGELYRTLTGHTNTVSALVFLSETELASGSWDETIKVWDIPTGKLKRTLNGHENEVHALKKLPCGDLVSCSMDGSIKVWDQLNGEIKQSMENETSSVYSISVMDDGRIASGWEDNTIKILKL